MSTLSNIRRLKKKTAGVNVFELKKPVNLENILDKLWGKENWGWYLIDLVVNLSLNTKIFTFISISIHINWSIILLKANFFS